MSRVAKSPVALPKGVEVTISGQQLQVKGGKGTLSLALNALVDTPSGVALDVKATPARFAPVA